MIVDVIYERIWMLFAESSGGGGSRIGTSFSYSREAGSS